MSKGLKIGLILGGLVITGGMLAYYRAAQTLDIGLKGVKPTGLDQSGNLLFDVTLSVNNPSAIGFPVPTVDADLYAGDQHIATGVSTDWQYIAPHTTSYLSLVATVSIAEAGPFIYNSIVNNQVPADLNLKGTAHIVGYNLDFATQILQLTS